MSRYVDGWHCDCRVFSEEDDTGKEVLEPCCWCGDNNPTGGVSDDLTCSEEFNGPCKSEAAP